jgi:exosortase/archaeosortase family protein
MMQRLRNFLAAQWLTIRVVGSFLLLITAFFSVLTYEPILRYVDVGRGLAQLSAWVSWVFLKGLGAVMGFPVRISGTNLGSGEYVVDVSPACSAAVPMMIYMSAVLAFPASRRAKLLGVLIGFGVIYTVNLVRVISLFLIGLFASQYFHDTHVYVAQALVVCIAVATWLFWAGRFADAPGH